MSGASVAAGPREHKHPPGKGSEVKGRMREEEGAMGGIMGSFRVLELQLVAFIIIFSASGLVPVQDLLFPVILTIYAAILSVIVFPTYEKSSPPDLFKGNRLLQGYIVLGTAIGLFLPLAYVMGGFARGDRVSVKDAAPHLFILSCQILTENIMTGLGVFSLPVRALLLVLYTSRRLFALSDWAVAVWVHTQEQKPDDEEVAANPLVPDSFWIVFGRSLAVANTLYYSINLFCFLIPFFLPRAFEYYFKDRAKYQEENPNVGIGEKIKNGASKLTPKMPTFDDEKKDETIDEKKDS